MNAPERFTLQLTRFIRAPRDKVFDAFVKPEMLAAWMGSRGTQVDSAQADAREGGAWRVAMHAMPLRRFARVICHGRMRQRLTVLPKPNRCLLRP